MSYSSIQSFSPSPKVPAALLDGWLPCLPSLIRPTMIARGHSSFLAKFDVGPVMSPHARRQLSSAIESLAPCSLGVDSILGTQLYHSPRKGSAIAVIWLPDEDPHKLSGKYVSNLTTTKALPRGFSGTISGDYVEVDLANLAPVVVPPKDTSLRHSVKKARLNVAHIFPGIVRIVVDLKEGRLSTSFENTKIHSILKHRELYVRILKKHGFDVDDSEGSFTIGTWRYDSKTPGKKNLFHVLKLKIPSSDGRRVLCSFKPVWSRVVRPKTDEEIDNELNELFINREELLKRLKIKTSTHQNEENR